MLDYCMYWILDTGLGLGSISIFNLSFSFTVVVRCLFPLTMLYGRSRFLRLTSKMLGIDSPNYKKYILLHHED